MKKLIIFALALALTGGAAYATWCARDFVPAATLLVPYIVVDMNADGTPNVNGYTTLTIVTNVSSTKQLIHVTVFDVFSRGVVDFDEVLSGYDVWSINWRDLLNGRFDLFDTGPGKLASASANPSYTATLFGGALTPCGFWYTSPCSTANNLIVGTLPSQFGPTTNVSAGVPNLNNPQDVDNPVLANATCGFSWGNLASFGPTIVAGLQDPFRAYVTQDTHCDSPAVITDDMSPNVWLKTLGPATGWATNNPLFFYATIDVVKACNGLFPDKDPAYWAAPQYPVANNVLIGDDFYLNSTLNYSESTPAISIEADTAWKSVNRTGFYTKQRALTGVVGLDLLDDREPLGNAFAFNYITGGGISTEVAVWKNRLEIEKTTLPTQWWVRACRPYIYYAWDENEKGITRTGTSCPSGQLCYNWEPNVFPFETQKVAVTTTNFDGIMANGWMLLVFDPAIPYPSAFTPPLTEPQPRAIQAAVFAKYNWGGYSTSIEAAQLANTWCWPAQTIANLTLDTYFGNGLPALGGFILQTP